MIFSIDLKRALTTRLSHLAPTRPVTQRDDDSNTTQPQDVYESIALGNALADAEDAARRQWSGR